METLRVTPTVCALSEKEATGVNTTGTLDKEKALPFPQPFTPLTDMARGPVPAVRVIELLVLDPVHPVPAIVQL